MYEYQTSWHFGLFGINALLGTFSLKETGRFVVISALGGLPNFLENCYIYGSPFRESNEPPGSLTVFVT